VLDNEPGTWPGSGKLWFAHATLIEMLLDHLLANGCLDVPVGALLRRAKQRPAVPEQHRKGQLDFILRQYHPGDSADRAERQCARQPPADSTR